MPNLLSTTSFRETPSVCGKELMDRFLAVAHGAAPTWSTSHRKIRLLGSGGQGVVYLGERCGTDSFALPVALKFFSPQHHRDADDYAANMQQVARIAARVALIQHDNVLDIHNFIEHEGIRIMEMEWVDGFDLGTLVTVQTLDRTRQRVRQEQWQYINSVVVTAGPQQPRLKPGIAIQVLRECLAGLAALHREGIVHGDIKPSNIMLKRTGNAKVVDIGSAIDFRSGNGGRRFWSPAYAAPEILDGGENSPLSDLASLGYLLIELLAGRSLFRGLDSYAELLKAKKKLVAQLPDLLPEEVSCNELLLYLCKRLIAFDPSKRFRSAEVADLGRRGAAAFHRQLVKGDLASEYENDLRVWLEQLG